MDPWSNYEQVHNRDRRTVRLDREKHLLKTKMQNSLSYHTAVIDGVDRNVAITNTDNLDTKHIFSVPGEDLPHGGYVEWMGNHWLITERDANSEIYTKCVMLQCNYLLKWVDEDDVIHEQWCIVEDGTKYLTGEYEDRNFVVTRGDSRIAVTIARNEYTSKLGRVYRFLIDDPNSTQRLAYSLTKPLKLYNVFNGNGVFKFVLQEVNSTDDDNFELGIADYYKHFPRDGQSSSDEPSDGQQSGTEQPADDNPGRRVWL